MSEPRRLQFTGGTGEPLAGRLHLPEGQTVGHALIAHCFTCSKDYKSMRRISETLAEHGFGALSFDFTGLGESRGDFASTTFSSNLEDIEAAAAFLKQEAGEVSLLVGHSLGGAAVLAAAERIPSVRAVATIAAPSDTEQLARKLDDARGRTARGAAGPDGNRDDTGDQSADPPNPNGQDAFEVEIGGRRIRLGSGLLEDLRKQNLHEKVSSLPAPLMIFHSPSDRVVDIAHARKLFELAPHPKSFVSLGEADHLLIDQAEDAIWVGHMLAAWGRRYV